jgi:methylmalonyl-CoA/ethylmalonyl-CoA epimerase
MSTLPSSNTEIDFSFHHIGISVPRLVDSIQWYTNVLGFELARTLDIPSLTAKVAVLKKGSMHVELFEVAGAEAPAGDRSDPHGDLHTFGNKHVGFTVPDVRRLVAVLRQRGADIISVNDFKFGTNAFIRDNAGNVIEFVQAR